MTRCIMLICLACTIVSAGCGAKEEEMTIDAAIRKVVMPATPQQQAARAFNPDDADQRREGILALSKHGWGLKEPYLKAYALLADDVEPSVRCAAVTALGKAGNAAYLPQLIRRLEDPAELVRIDAARALGNVRGEAAVQPLEKHATSDSSADVRAACARTLRNYPGAQTVTALLKGLEDRSFGVRHASRESLTVLTQQDHGYDSAAWRSHQPVN